MGIDLVDVFPFMLRHSKHSERFSTACIMLILSEKEVQNLIDIEELIAALEQAHIQYSTGKAALYKSVGIAIQDVATAHLVYQKALQRKVGTHVEI